MPLVPIKISGGENRNVEEMSLGSHCASVINWMLDESGSLITRPGMRTFGGPVSSILNLGTGIFGPPPLIALTSFQEFVVGVDINRRVWSFAEDGSMYQLPGKTVPGTAQPIGFVDDNNVLLIAGGGSPVQWKGAGYPVEAQSSQPTGVPQPTSLIIVNRYLIANNIDSDNINYTTTFDHSAWDTAAREFQAESRNDPCIAMIAHNNFLYLFGTHTLDVYYPSGIDAPPFARSHALTVGLIGPRGAILVENAIYFMDSKRRIVKINDNEQTVQVLSFEIERVLLELEHPEDVIAHNIIINGKHLIVFVFQRDATAFVYDYALSKAGAAVWTEWRGRLDGKWVAPGLAAYTYQPRWNRHFCAGVTDGKVYELTMDAADDHGEELLRVLRTGYRGQTHRTRSKAIWITMSRGSTPVITPGANGYDPFLLMRDRNEDGIWSAETPMSLGKVGENDLLEPVRNLGTYRMRQTELSTAAPIPRLGVASVVEDAEVFLR